MIQVSILLEAIDKREKTLRNQYLQTVRNRLPSGVEGVKIVSWIKTSSSVLAMNRVVSFSVCI